MVRGRSRLKETRGLASVDRTRSCVVCVRDWCRWGRANDSRSQGQTGRLRGRGAGGLPGPGSFQNALGAREEYSRVAANGVASSVQDVNRYTAVVSDSPRRRSVGHASRSQLGLSRRGSGDIRSVTPATTRACPVGGPGDARRLGDPEFRLHAPDARRDRAGLVAASPLYERDPPRSGRLLFSGILPRLDEEPPRPGPTERWSIAERRSHRVVLSNWVFRAAGRPEFPCPCNFGA